MTLTFDGLPVDVKRIICEHVPKADLLNVRLVSSTLCALATGFAFQSISLLADAEVAKAFVNISASDALRRHVRHVTLDTNLEDYDYANDPGEEWDFPAEFYRALPKLNRFHRLSSLLLCFSNFCITDPHLDYLSTAEDEHFRFDILNRVSTALSNPKFPTSDFKVLEIHNLQNRNDQVLKKKYQFLSLLQRVEILRLHIIHHENDILPETNIEDRAQYEFLDELPSVWLQPVSSRLTTLSLYQSNYWGWCPKFRGFQLEHPKALALGHFTFAHQDHLDWILGHGNTLQELYLDHCPIVYAANTRGPMGDDGFPEKQVMIQHYYRGPTIHWTYEKRWSDYLMEFKHGLPKLKVFNMGRGDWPLSRSSEENRLKPFISYKDMISGELVCEYVYFDIDLGPSQWLVDNEDEPLPPDCEDTDYEALKQLWETVDARMAAGTRES